MSHSPDQTLPKRPSPAPPGVTRRQIVKAAVITGIAASAGPSFALTNAKADEGETKPFTPENDYPYFGPEPQGKGR